MTRNALSFRRELEFVEETELAKRMGCPRYQWLRAVIKELIDNALDAAEEAGEAHPVVAVGISEDGVLSCGSSGSGIAPETVAKLADREQRTSSREAYAEPVRGAQGNALSVIMCLPFGFGLDESELHIASCGVLHRIALRADRLQGRIETEHTSRPVEMSAGWTEVGLWWPEEIDLAAIARIVIAAAALNPHAIISFNGAQLRDTVLPVRKWAPNEPIPPHWYDIDRFVHRVSLEIRNDPEITVAQFLAGFRGLSSSTKRSEVAANAGLSYAPLRAVLAASGREVDREKAALLLASMQTASRAPKPSILGGIGRDGFEALVSNVDYDADPDDDDLTSYTKDSVTSNDRQGSNHDQSRPQVLAYTTIDGVTRNDIPWRWEIGFATRTSAEGRGRHLVIGQNFSPAIVPEEMLGSVTGYLDPSLSHREPVVLFLHRITPARHSLDYGKSRLSLSYAEQKAVQDAIEKLAKPWTKWWWKERKRKKDDNDEAKSAKPEQRITIKDAIISVLPECYDKASSGGRYPVPPRNLYYVVRPKVLELTGKTELGYPYFAADILPKYVQENPSAKSWRIFYKPRGTLHEPHTRHRVGLGTSEVASYQHRWTNGIEASGNYEIADWNADTCGPHNRFSALIIVEKAGIADLLIACGIAERFDVAIVGNEGQSTEAELKLADELQLPVFVLHDFDRTGLTICENLRRGTWRHQYRNEFDVIEIGLRLDQVRDREREPIDAKNRRSVTDERLRECGATDEEVNFLFHNRVELNALLTEELLKLVEGAITEYGIKKVVPAADDLANAYRAAVARKEIAETVSRVAEEAEERWREAKVPDDLEESIHVILGNHPSLSWDAALLAIVERGDDTP